MGEKRGSEERERKRGLGEKKRGLN